ncbi:hypothetical protein [Nocardioides sp. WS12]|uniref:hypothetical protein n=1 Tax=Nocardioides sp. WS12 TaxID=2486272 RepID=UPI0015F9AA07|nr:hypothetical protein [Nocardioides sp. WS12]
MSATTSLFSVKSQRAILWWGIGLAVAYALALIFLMRMVPPPSADWSAESVSEFYRDHSTSIRWGAVISGWTGAFMMPILAVVAIQMARVETGGAKIWSALSLVSGALMSLFLALPPIFWGAAAFTADREPEITALAHQIGLLTLTTTDQYYIFMWVGVTVLALRPATQLVSNNPFPRWWGYLSLWITVMFEAGAFAFIPKTGPLAWNGLLVFWSPLTLFGVWITIQCWLLFRALRGQEDDQRSGAAKERDLETAFL